jgi:hypothetical protein
VLQPSSITAWPGGASQRSLDSRYR